MTATSTAETSTSMSIEPRSSARLRDGLEVMSVTTPWSRRARGRWRRPRPLCVDGLPSPRAPAGPMDYRRMRMARRSATWPPAAVDGLAGDEHGDPRGALEAAERAARQAHRDDGGARLLELDRRRAEHVGLRLGLREPQAPGVGGLQAGRDAARGGAVGVAAQAQALLGHELERLDRRALEARVERGAARVRRPTIRRRSRRARRLSRPEPPRAAGAATGGASAVPGSNGEEPPPTARAPGGALTTSALRATAVRPSSSVARTPMLITVALGKLRGHERRGAAVGLEAAVAVEVPLVAHDGPVVASSRRRRRSRAGRPRPGSAWRRRRATAAWWR